MRATFYNRSTGEHEPVDMQKMRQELSGCIVCGSKHIVLVGVFVPSTDEMRAALHKIRNSPQRPGTVTEFVYGLCATHPPGPDTLARVEEALLAEARRMKIQ